MNDSSNDEVVHADDARDGACAWWVYVLIACDARRTYVGATNDPQRRLRQHNGLEHGGAANTRAHRPWSIGTTYGPFANRADAQRAESRVKRLGGARRLAWKPVP